MITIFVNLVKSNYFHGYAIGKDHRFFEIESRYIKETDVYRTIITEITKDQLDEKLTPYGYQHLYADHVKVVDKWWENLHEDLKLPESILNDSLNDNLATIIYLENSMWD